MMHLRRFSASVLSLYDVFNYDFRVGLEACFDILMTSTSWINFILYTKYYAMDINIYIRNLLQYPRIFSWSEDKISTMQNLNTESCHIQYRIMSQHSVWEYSLYSFNRKINFTISDNFIMVTSKLCREDMLKITARYTEWC